MAPEQKYHSDLEGRIARITISRPEKYNAINPETEEELFRAFYDTSRDPVIGVVVLTGAGDHFSTGGEVAWEQWRGRAFSAGADLKAREPILADSQKMEEYPVSGIGYTKKG